MTISKTDLILQLTSLMTETKNRKGQSVVSPKYTKKQATELVDDFCKAVATNLEHGDPVSIYGFGCFDIVERAERTCTTPQGDKMAVPAHWSPKFYPGNTLRRAVKKWADNSKRGLT